MSFKKLSFVLSAMIVLFGFWFYKETQKKDTPSPLFKDSLLDEELNLRNQEGQAITGQSFRGSYWVVNFFFSRCHGTCPLLNQKVAKLQDAWKDVPEIKLASFSVDPDFDTPEILKEYSHRFHSNPEKWWFLTGKKDTIKNVARQVFKVAVDEEPSLHSLRLVLLNPQGHVVGYYDSEKEDEIEQLIQLGLDLHKGLG
jgi:protein SCO1/2